MSYATPQIGQELVTELEAEIERLRAALQSAIELVLLFYTADWTDERKARWIEITGKSEATTKTLCDYIRALKEEP